jgi:hypothetical protein
MSFFRTPTAAPVPKSKNTATISLFYAVLLVVMVIAQLFTFESFLALFAAFELPGGQATGYAVAALLVASQVFALPFLLRMALSPAFRMFSLLSAGLVADIWLFITLWLAIVQPVVSNVGFLGTIVDVIPGWWAVCLALAFGILALWAAWGMWPSMAKPATRKK